MLTVANQQFDLLINGKSVAASGGRSFEAINPSNGKAFAAIADATAADIGQAITAARAAFDSGVWPGMTVVERGIYLKKIAQGIRKHAKELADLETVGCGKTLKQSTFIDVPTAADCFEYFSNISQELAAKENKIDAPVKSLTEREPVGVVGCIIPWNYPLIMSAWKIAPALVVGNTVILKPSALGCASVMRLAKIIEESGLPAGVVNIVATTDHAAASVLVKDPRVDMLSFTGGTQTGQEMMQLASATTKKLSLELGGKSPNIVFSDCDLDAAVGGTLSAIFMNQGQMCTAGARLLLEEKIYDKFLAKLIEKTQSLTIGPATDYQVNFGPLISREHRDKVLKFIAAGVAEGAQVACGGKIPSDPKLKEGFFIEPTILINVTNSMKIAQEEIFGPVLCVLKFSDCGRVATIANDNPYGLAACIWTKDLEKAAVVAKQLRCGTVWINTYGGFYNESSFGGYKQSGFGRTLGKEGLLEYTQSKHICTDKSPGGKPLVTNWF
ncbi:MAG: hypothetical protein A2787_07345 [Omnitrophica WOR_2 bacterium RIFCSPHIGHO2_01_FULL_48_9]|nr:MAG: hypothetical protein A3D10_06380 [Omnitrophica WOR_2 bacterium RIFCSPHIGHO2_02_FULL_48_11]OGX33564.1 MAG: hypothetical protein A2787_07345 [Omnitrophica WOR_2 bacterium RIFCSPHIGHO2_01_FULL_48_9]